MTPKLILFLVTLFTVIHISLGAPVHNLIPRVTDGCYMVLSPNPTTDLLVGYQGGTYKINVKFGDGAKADRDKAYAGTNPNFKFTYNEGDLNKCGKTTEQYTLQELMKDKPNAVVKDPLSESLHDLLTGSKDPHCVNNHNASMKSQGVEWYTFIFGTDLVKAKNAFDALNQELVDFGKSTFTNEAEVKDWAKKFVINVEGHLST
ncbi:hypothetical protein EV359DRAFT_86777 [Lentinula novae-zelandiae]|nr:hypothetical protein EV359DRAFT_86777 [Lentinula novae-zelandiae]